MCDEGESQFFFHYISDSFPGDGGDEVVDTVDEAAENTALPLDGHDKESSSSSEDEKVRLQHALLLCHI